MSKIIYEEYIENSILDLLSKPELNYNILRLDPDTEKMTVLPDGTGRKDKKDCVLPDILYASLKRLNPTVDDYYIKQVYDNLCSDFTGSDILNTNYLLYKAIRNDYEVSYVNDSGIEDKLHVKLIDFDNIENNDFTAVSQMWIKGKYNWRRPDILIFVNGLPLVFVELKNSDVKVEEAYIKNLLNYKKDIPNLFAFNQICVLSNGYETRLGAFSSSYDFFFEWLKVNDEKEKVDRAKMHEDKESVYAFVKGLLNKERLIDYIGQKKRKMNWSN